WTLAIAPAWGQFRDITPPEASPAKTKKAVADELAPPDPEPMPDSTAEREQPGPASELLPAADRETATREASATRPRHSAKERRAELARQISDQIDKELIDDTELRAIRFRGVLVGETNASEMTQLWGQPFKIIKSQNARTFKYRALPFRQVDVTVENDQVTAILIHLFDMQDPGHIARELRMTRIEPVPIPDEFGNVMGMSFPERGVLLGFDYRDPESLVAKILLEPVNPEPFLLRAEYDFEHNYSQDLADIQTAIRLNPRYARAHALQGQRLMELGRYRDALEAVERALDLDPEMTRCSILRARLLEALGKYGPARRQAEQALLREDTPPEMRAQVAVILGDVLAQEKPGQFNRALRKHLKGIELAAPLANDPRFEVRRAAKRTLIEAHLAVARDISLGNFQRQLEVVPKWVDRAKALVEEYVQRDQGDRALRLVAAHQSLAAAADVQNPSDPGRWIDDLFEEGRKQIAFTEDAANRHRVEWLLASALSEAVRLQRLRGETDEALDAANDALTLFQQSAPERQSSPSQKYLVGRL
ncbi:MAG TPA: tetratricopeptide repeat protein, partial [Pirellulaceae bacterium]